MRNQKQPHRSAPCMFENLEGRQFLSASSAVVKPDATFATTTDLFVSNRSPVLGQTLTVKGVVTSSGGTPRGSVELLDGDKDTGLTGTLNHLGYYVFTLDAGQSPYVGTHEYRIRYLSSGNFVGSKSRQLIAKVKGPALTTESDGLQLGTVMAGTGAVPKANQMVTVQYTGFNLATGAVFDDSAAHSPGTFSFILDDSTEEQVIPGFDQEVTGMKVGETRVAIIPEALAYPTSDTSSALAGDTLVFIVHLVSIV